MANPNQLFYRVLAAELVSCKLFVDDDYRLSAASSFSVRVRLAFNAIPIASKYPAVTTL
jgi:hypothetical protein